ncbi:hypothetical protein GPECTOR_36g110 [Gonium pectorale]|uniref:Protein kinase domain-containing protein n=1 Tax=Gonium pectorale TaxID=33097 RepID=A0A150GBN2_GONPE|nr:hypothetical protein GPECTOR_36g110 [Gonium pectorale]|eukprot:KXZ47257.1 hypothetical protein GPECTOR_36g110 [Gonium pectorale]
MVSHDLNLTATDWVGVSTPLYMARNFSVVGVLEDPLLWPTLDMGYLENKVPALQRCWAAVGMYVDASAWSSSIDALSTMLPAGYITHCRNATYLVGSMSGPGLKCPVVMSLECATQLGAAGCFYSMFPRLLPPPSAPPPGPSSAGEGGEAGRRNFLVALLAGLLTGLAVAVIVAGLAVVAVRLRKRRCIEAAPASFQELGTIEGGACAGDASPRCVVMTPQSSGGTPLGVPFATSFGGLSAQLPAYWKAPEQQRSPRASEGLAASQSSYPSPSSSRPATSPRPPGDWELVPVTPLTPMLPDVNVDLAPGEVELTGTVLGKGAYGRVVVGTYGGRRVAVKLVNTGLVLPARDDQQGHASEPAVAATEPAAAGSAAAPERRPEAPLDAYVAEGRARTDLGPSEQGAGSREGAALPVRGDDGDPPSGGVGDDGRDGAPTSATYAQLEVRACDRGDEDHSAANPPTGEEERLLAARASEYGRAFGREVAVLARCRHPNIVRLLAASLQPCRLCLVMELMESSLDRLLYGGRSAGAAGGTGGGVLHIALQVARALAYLHPTVLHRDLKPANVLITDAGSDLPVAKLADFGLSRLASTVLLTRNPEVGTVPYMAPEVFDLSNREVTDRVVAYTVTALHKRLPMDAIPPERRLPKLEALINECWDAVPARRPAAAEAVKALALAQEVGV